ncbi:MAG TPA: FecR domain-containing protein [Cyclobacteriaceae bacterium]|jgi:ferric-dicitrate binding protein FerR (iron transport regulator)
MNTPEEFRNLLKRYRQGQCTPEERKLVDEWFAGISSEVPSFSPAEMDALKEESWRLIEKRIGSAKRATTFRRLTSVRLVPMAAVILLLLMAGTYWWYSGEPQFNEHVDRVYSATEPAELVNTGTTPVNHVLPDGSKIRLLPGSRLTLMDSFGEAKREVFLDGEAFFDIARDTSRPFLVYTKGITAEVLGTSFLISAYSDQEEIVVAVKTGKVSVYTNSKNSPNTRDAQSPVILSPNQKVTYNPNEHVALKQLVDEPEVILPEPTLKESYTNAPVIEILESLEENYGIEIRYDAEVLANCTLTSDMSEEGFYEQIKIICNALGAKHEITEDAVIIEASACSPR